jgi:hypothetical protein
VVVPWAQFALADPEVRRRLADLGQDIFPRQAASRRFVAAVGLNLSATQSDAFRRTDQLTLTPSDTIGF